MLTITGQWQATDQEPSDEHRARLARRLQSWLASNPAPEDIVDAFYHVARQLDEAVPGGLETTSGDLPLRALCRCLLYCDLDDFMAVWPAVRSQA